MVWLLQLPNYQSSASSTNIRSVQSTGCLAFKTSSLFGHIWFVLYHRGNITCQTRDLVYDPFDTCQISSTSSRDVCQNPAYRKSTTGCSVQFPRGTYPIILMSTVTSVLMYYTVPGQLQQQRALQRITSLLGDGVVGEGCHAKKYFTENRGETMLQLPKSEWCVIRQMAVVRRTESRSICTIYVTCLTFSPSSSNLSRSLFPYAGHIIKSQTGLCE